MVFFLFFRITTGFFQDFVLFRICNFSTRATNKKAPFSKGARQIQEIGKRFGGLWEIRNRAVAKCSSPVGII